MAGEVREFVVRIWKRCPEKEHGVGISCPVCQDHFAEVDAAKAEAFAEGRHQAAEAALIAIKNENYLLACKAWKRAENIENPYRRTS